MQHASAIADLRWSRYDDHPKTKKSNAVYESLKRLIVIGDLTPASSITEQALARDYDCSQSTVREALLRLQEDGLVLRHGYRGTSVTEASDEETALMLRLRLSIELSALEQVVANITPDRIADLRVIADLYDERRAERDLYGVSEADIAFHMTLHQVANMPVVEPILQRSIIHVHRFLLTRHRPNLVWIKEIEASHSALLDAIEAGDYEAAKDLTYRHTTTSTIEVDPAIRQRLVGAL